MRQVAIAMVAAVLWAAPGQAQQEGGGDVREGLDQLGEGAQQLFDGLMDELGPALNQFSESVDPMMRELRQMVDDLSAYEAPEMLPNGDIIIRRKDDAPAPEGQPGADGEIEI